MPPGPADRRGFPPPVSAGLAVVRVARPRGGPFKMNQTSWWDAVPSRKRDGRRVPEMGKLHQMRSGSSGHACSHKMMASVKLNLPGVTKKMRQPLDSACSKNKKPVKGDGSSFCKETVARSFPSGRFNLLPIAMIKGYVFAFLMLAAIGCRRLVPARTVHDTITRKRGWFIRQAYLTLHVPTGDRGLSPGLRGSRARFDVHMPDEETVTDGKYTLAIDPQSVDARHRIRRGTRRGRSVRPGSVAGPNRTGSRRSTTLSQHAVELTHAQHIDGVNAAMVAASRIGNYAPRACTDPTSLVGGWSGYGSYGYYNGTSGVTLVGGGFL